MQRIFVIASMTATLFIINSCSRTVPEESLTVTALTAAAFSSSVVSVHSNKCIEAGEVRADGAVPLVQKTCTERAAQTFDFHPVPGKENVYVLENTETKTCLDFSLSRKTDEGSPIVQQFGCHGGENQQLELKPQGDAYALVAQSDQKCVDVQRNSQADGAALHAWDCHGGDNQAWQIDTTLLPADPTPAEDSVGLDARPTNTTCLAPKKVAAKLGLQRRFTGLSFEALLGLEQAPDSTSYWYALEKAGRVLRFPNSDDVKQSEVETVIDLRSKVSDPSEAGLLGLAFHPDFADNGYVFLHYNYGNLRSRIARFTTTDNGRTLAPGSEKTLLDLEQPYNNHNGGDITFGPDGYLYIAFGDGGSQGDPGGNAQNKNTLLGSILRIDVNGDPYTIPADNPFVGDGGAEEIFAYGLRNPWRLSFDRETGALWSADVGQNAYEEVNLIESGKNYGWNEREGLQCYKGSCSNAGFTDPVYEYSHDVGRSVTGGYVYRGEQVADLVGTYVYGDYVSGTVWGLSPDGDGYSNRTLLESGFNLSSFAEDNGGELYALDFGGGIYQFTASATEASLPEKLSETGCVDAANPTEMASGVIPYEVALPFWSDGAEKSRWFALPDGADFTVDSAGDWELPPGGVSIKEFRLGGKRIETRFYVRYTDGSYSGYTYEWNDAQTDATLLTEGKEKNIGGQTWIFPSSAACNSCHTQAAGYSLGLETRQLNRAATYPSTNRTAQQIATLKAIGILPASTEDIAAHPALDDSSVSATARAQAYLDVNCSSCHRPGGPGGGDMDLRSSTPFRSSNTCNVTPTSGDLGRDNAKLIVPGSREDSVLWIRLSSREGDAMPPLGSNVRDESGSAFLGDWIDGLATCNG